MQANLAAPCAGGLASYLIGPLNQVSIGASGAIFGLFGAWIFVAWKMRLGKSTFLGSAKDGRLVLKGSVLNGQCPGTVTIDLGQRLPFTVVATFAGVEAREMMSLNLSRKRRPWKRMRSLPPRMPRGFWTRAAR